MNPLRWRLVVVGALAVVCAAALLLVRAPQRSALLEREEPRACGLLAEHSPFGGITACTVLGRRTPPLSGGTVFLLLETDGGPAVVRVDYTGTGGDFSATAVEVPTWEAPGISHETGERIKTGIDARGGLKAGKWVVKG